VSPTDEVFAITSAGGVIRTAASEVKLSGRQTMGVRLMNLAPGDSVVAVARNAEAEPDAEGETDDTVGDGEEAVPAGTDRDTSLEAGQDTGDGPVQPAEGGTSDPPDATEPGPQTS
jgi:DNA gyrase C-terminal domain, beta-propeller